MSRKVLTDEHPLVDKFNQLADLATELGIRITIGRYREMFVDYDRETYVVMSDDGQNEHEFPPAFECEIVTRDE